MGEMIPVVGFYTIDTSYQQEAEAMKASALTVGIEDVYLYPVKSLGTWERNCQQKAEILFQACKDLRRPFLYVDADARFNQLPSEDWEAWERWYDIGIHYFRGIEALSGTMYINPTPHTRFLLLNWISLCMDNPRIWDQKLLDNILKINNNTRIKKLIPEYTWIFDLFPRQYGQG